MRILTYVLLVLSFNLTACDSSGADDDNYADDAEYADAAGTYQLQTVDGQNLPVDIDDEGVTVTVTDGNVRLNSNRTFSVTFTVVEDGQTESETDTGEYEMVGDDIFFTYAFHEDVGSLSGDMLILKTQGYTAELTR